MKKLLCVLLLMSWGLAQAKPIDVIMREVPLLELVRLYFTDMARENYVLDSVVLQDQSIVTVEAYQVERQELADLLRGFLSDRGYTWQRVGKLNIVSSTRLPEDPAPQLLTYRPRYRSVDYLAGLVAPFIKSAETRQNHAGAPIASKEGAKGVSHASRPVAAPGVRPGVGSDVLVIEAAPDQIHKVQTLLAELDQPAGEVLVKGVVFEVSEEESDESAVAMVLELLNGRVKAETIGPNLGNYARLKFGGLDVLVSSLARDARFKVMSSPRLRVRSGEVARVQVGTETPVLDQVTVADGGQLVQSVEYRQSGVILELEPHVLAEGVDLHVRQQLSEFIETATGVNASPTLLKREVSTMLTVQSGEVVVLAGLDQEKTTTDSTGLSFLPRFLRTNGSSSTKSELLILLEVTRL